MWFDDERAAIEGRFQTNWTDPAPVKYENVPLVPDPHDINWVALTIRTGRGQQISLGDDPVYRYPGVIVVQVFVPKDAGSATAKKLADKVTPIFNRARFQAGVHAVIKCQATYMIEVGVLDGWYQINVTTPFYRDARQIGTLV